MRLPLALSLLAAVFLGCAPTHTRPNLDALAAEIGTSTSEHVEMGQRVRHGEVRMRADVRLSSGAEVGLVEEDGALHIAHGVLGATASQTPQDAIAALHRALNRELETGLDHVLAEPARSAWREERERYRDGTRYPEALECNVDGGHAIAVTPMGDEIELVLEGSSWRVLQMRAPNDEMSER